MTASLRSLRPEHRAPDCWDWITPDDVVRHAVAAFHAAAWHVSMTDDGSPWLDADGTPWSGRADFRDALAAFFQQRINAQALEAGVTAASACAYPELPPGLHWPTVADARRAADLIPAPSSPSDACPGVGLGPGCRGGTPAAMGHGCPALDLPAVGPAPASVSGADITLPADPLFLGRPMQELLGGDNPANNLGHGGNRRAY